MAHTPLLQRIIDSCAIAAEASRRNVSVEHVLEERARHFSRRDFLGVAAAGVALAACDSTGMSSFEPQHAWTFDPGARVVIVGAGLAGLTCAHRLRQQGVRATIYEANDRLGGRCRTRRGDFAQGQIAEHGGELIDQSHKHIRQLAQELGLQLDNVLSGAPNGTEPCYYFDGSEYSFRDATNEVKTIWQPLHRDLSSAGYPTLHDSFTPRGAQLDNMSVADWINATVPGGRASRLGKLLDTAYNIEYGEEIDAQSALNLIYLLGFSGQGQLRIFGPSNEKYHVRGGNDLIVSRLAAPLSGQIVMGTPLVSMRRSSAGAYVLTFDGVASDVVADKVILTVPFAVMRNTVDYGNAGFGALKLKAINELRMGANAKLNVQFNTRHWWSRGCSGDSFADTGYQATWDVSRGQSGTAGILVNYTGGAVARAQGGGSAPALAAQFLTQIEPVLPGLSARWNGLATFDDWQANPWSLGSYSYWRVGQYTGFAGIERAQDGDCHFAGEHTSVDYQGYLNGAVESGERAASEVLADLRIRR